jgi:TetR/AcrR family transcriptional repressor of bet genes
MSQTGIRTPLFPKKHRTPRKPSKTALQRRRDLQDAAIQAIAQYGVSSVTISMICEMAGFSRGLIGHYFKGKDDLLIEAISRMSTQLAEANREAANAAGPDPVKRLHAVIHSSFSSPTFTRERVLVWVALVGSAPWSPSLARIYRTLWRKYRVGIARLLRKAADERGLKIDADLAALAFSQTIEGFWVGWAVDPTSVNKSKAEAACHQMLEHLLKE